MPLTLQHDAMQCGIACLSMVFGHYGRNYSIEFQNHNTNPRKREWHRIQKLRFQIQHSPPHKHFGKHQHNFSPRQTDRHCGCVGKRQNHFDKTYAWFLPSHAGRNHSKRYKPWLSESRFLAQKVRRGNARGCYFF